MTKSLEDSQGSSGEVEGRAQETQTQDAASPEPPRVSRLLLATVFAVAVCTLVYELLAGAVSSYLLGNSILYFSLVVGVFLFAMGVGSFLSRFVRAQLLRTFLLLEIGVAFLGGSSALILFFCFPYPAAYLPVLLGLCAGVGVLSGVEVPLVIRILRERGGSLDLSASNVMSADYLGGLAGSLAFPLLILPQLGLLRGALAVGLLNMAVVWLGLVGFRRELGRQRALSALALLVTAALGAGLLGSSWLVERAEERNLPDRIVFTHNTARQRVIVTKFREDLRVFAGGELRLSTLDAHRSSESLVHPALSSVLSRHKILLIGGDDGLSARECLRYEDLQQLDLLIQDPELHALFRPEGPLAHLSGAALSDPRVRRLEGDPASFLRASQELYDAILIELPEPVSEERASFYTASFYAAAAARLSPGGALSVRCSSPWWAPEVFWCVIATLESAGLQVRPYQVTIPSLGQRGFALAGRSRPELVAPKVETRFLDLATLQRSAVFAPDVARRPVEVNRLETLAILRYFRAAMAEGR